MVADGQGRGLTAGEGRRQAAGRFSAMRLTGRRSDHRTETRPTVLADPGSGRAVHGDPRRPLRPDRCQSGPHRRTPGSDQAPRAGSGRSGPADMTVRRPARDPPAAAGTWPRAESTLTPDSGRSLPGSTPTPGAATTTGRQPASPAGTATVTAQACDRLRRSVTQLPPGGGTPA